MKLHLPKLLRNAVLACIALATTPVAYTLTVHDGYKAFDASLAHDSISYTVADGFGTLSGLDSGSITYTFVLNKTALSEGAAGTAIMYGDTTGNKQWGFRLYNSDVDPEAEIVGLWNDGVHAATTNYKEVVDLTNPIVTAKLQTSNPGTTLYTGLAASGTPFYQQGDLMTSSGGNFDSAVFNTSLVSALVMAEEGSKLLVSEDGSWVRSYTTANIATDVISETPVEATLITGTSLHVTGGASGNHIALNNNGGDIIVTGGGQLFLDAYEGGDISLENHIILGSSTNGGVANYGCLRISNDNGGEVAINLGRITVAGDASMISSGGGVSANQDCNDIVISGVVEGGSTLTVGGRGYKFKDTVNVGKLILKQGFWGGNQTGAGGMIFDEGVKVGGLTVAEGVEATFNDSLTIGGTVHNSGVINLNGGLVVEKLNGQNYDEYVSTYTSAVQNGAVSLSGYKNVRYYVVRGISNVVGDISSLTGSGNYTVIGDDLVSAAGSVETETFYVNEKIKWNEAGTAENGYTSTVYNDSAAKKYVVAEGAELNTGAASASFKGKTIELAEGATLKYNNVDGFWSTPVVGSGTVEATFATNNHDHSLSLGSEFTGTLVWVSGKGNLCRTMNDSSAATTIKLVGGESWGGSATINGTVLLEAESLETAHNIFGGDVIFAGAVTGNYLRKNGNCITTFRNDATHIEKLVISNGTTHLESGRYDSLALSGGTVNINGAVTLGGAIELSGSATVNVGESGSVVVADLASLTSTTEDDLTTNGLKGVEYTLIVGDSTNTTAAALSQSLGTVTLLGSSASYALENGKFTVGDVYYVVEAGNAVNVGGTDNPTTFGTEPGVFYVGDAGVLNINGDANTLTAKKAYSSTTGSGTVNINTEVRLEEVTYNSAFEGKTIVNTDGVLAFGKEEGNDAKDTRVVTLHGDVELAGGRLMFQGNVMNIPTLISTNDASILHLFDREASETGAVEINKLVLTNDLNVASRLEGEEVGWKYLLNVAEMSGAGDLIATSNEASTINIDSFNNYSGQISVGSSVTANLNINEGQTINAVANSGTTNLSGAGTYNLGSAVALGARVNLNTDTWTGTVKICNNNNLNSFNPTGLSTERSSVELSGTLGVWSRANTPAQTYDVNLVLTNSTVTKNNTSYYLAYGQNNGWDGDTRTIAGSVSGDGNWGRVDGIGTDQTWEFAGDVSGWTGKIFSNVTDSTRDTLYKFTGDKGLPAELNVTIANRNITSEGNYATSTTSGPLNIELNNESGFKVNGSIEASSLKLRTPGGVTLQNAVTVGTLDATGTDITLGKGGALTVTNGVTIGDGQSLTVAGNVAPTLVSSALTFQSGSSLTLGGEINLNDHVLTLATGDNKTALTFVNGYITEETEEIVLFSGLNSATSLGFTGSTTLGSLFNIADEELAAKTVSYVNGALKLLLAGVPEDILVVDSALTYAPDAEKTVVGVRMDGGTLSLGTDALANTITALEVTTLGGTLQGTEGGTVTEASFGSATVNGALSIADGGTDLTVKLGALTVGENGSITVAADQTLDLSAIDYASAENNADGVKISDSGAFNDVLAAVSGAGTLVLKASGTVGITGDATINTNVEMEKLTVNAWQANGGLYGLTIAEDASLSLEGNLGIENNAYVTVDGGALSAAVINLGHANGGYPGKLELKSGSITTGGISPTKAGATDANTFTMSAGTLEITSEMGIQEGIATTITGGTLMTGDNSWGIMGGRIGGVTIENATVTDGDTERAGTGTITLTNTTLTGTINNDGGKLALSGTVTLDDTDGAFQTQTTNTYYSDDTDTIKGNGFQIVDKLYTVATDASNLDVTGVTGSWMVGSIAGTYADGVVTVEGASTEPTYWIGNGELTYSAIKAKTNAEDEAISSIVLYQNGSATGSLELDETASGIAIQAKADTTLTLNGTGVVLTRDQITVDSGKSLTLDGNGVYDLQAVPTFDLGNPKAVLKVDFADSWTGTVKLTNYGANSTNIHSVLSTMGNENSTIAVSGVRGAGNANVACVSDLELLQDAEDPTKVSFLANGGIHKFEGKVFGNGIFKAVSSATVTFADAVSGGFTIVSDNSTTTFMGDVSDWEGEYKKIGSSSRNLTFSGSTEINATLTRETGSNVGTLNITIDDDQCASDYEKIVLNSTINRGDDLPNAQTNLIITEGTKVEIASSSVSVSGLNNAGITTVKSGAAVGISRDMTNSGTYTSAVDLAVGGNLTNSGTMTANGELSVTGAVTNSGTYTSALDLAVGSNLANSGTMTVNGVLSVTGAVTNSGTLNLTQDEATFASLAGIDGTVGTISAGSTALTVTGDATSGTITAQSLVLNGATNSLGDLNLGALTLGADVTSLSAGALNISGDMVVNKLSANLISSAGLADGASLNLSISEDVLREAITAKGLTSLVIGTITDLDIAKVKLNGDTTFDVGQYTFSINNDAASGVIELLASANGHTWGGNENDPADNSNWSEGLNWKEGIAPGGTSDTQAVKFLGDGSSEVVIGESMTIKYITVDIDGYTPDSETLTDTDPKKVGYAFTATEGSNWNVLTVEESLSVNKGLLNVGSNVNIEAEKRVEVLEAGELRIAEKAFVNAYAGIENAGKVTIDASSTPGGANAGALFVQGNGSITNSGELYVNGTLLAGQGMQNNPDGNDIINSGSIVNTGTIKADGDLLNTGSVSVDMGESEDKYSQLQVWGNVDNEGTDSSLDIDGGYVDVMGDLSNEGSLSVSGGAIVVDDGLDITEYNNLTVGGELDNSGTLTVSEAGTKVQAGSMTNSGSIGLEDGSIVVTGALTNTATDNADTSDVVEGITISGGSLTADSADNSGALAIVGGKVTVGDGSTITDADGNEVLDDTLTNSGTITIGSAAEGETPATTGSLVVNGDLANSGEINLVQGTIDVTGDLDNTGGTLTIAGGDLGTDAEDNTIYNLNVDGDLINTDGTVSISGNGTKAHVGGDLTLNPAGTDTTGSTLTVGEATELAVDGDLSADDVSLGFDGKVTVGGTATMENLTIAKGGAFTAENATISDTFTNNGKLTVTTTLVTDEDGNAELDENGNKQYTGGELTIGTLTGGGEVHVQEGGNLSIVDSVEFTGLLDNKGSMEFTATDAVVTLKNAQKDGHTAGDLTAAGIKVTADATGYTPDGGEEGSYVMGDIVTDNLTIADVKASAPRVTMDSLDAKTDGGKIKLVITDIEGKTMTSGSAHVISLTEEMDGGIFAEFDLGNYGYTDDGRYDKNAAAVQSDYMQALLKAGNRVYFTDTDPAATTALLAGGTSDVYVSIDAVQDRENIWNVGNAMTESGLTVIKDGKMVSDDILDNVQNTVMTGEQTIDLSGDKLTRLTLNKLTNKKGETTSKLTLEGDAGDTVTINNAAYAGTVELDTLSAVISGTVAAIEAGEGTGITAAVKDTTINVNGSDVLLSGSMENGAINIAEKAGVASASSLGITGTDLNIAYDDKGATTMDTSEVSETNQVLVDLGNMTGTAGDIVIGKDGKNSALLEKYFSNIRFDAEEGAVVADRNTSYFSDNYTTESANGAAGMTLADAALLKLNPQMDKDSALGAMLTAIEGTADRTERDELAASLAGASSAVLGMAVSGDVDRQLRAIRNRTTTMGVDQSVANEDMPYFNAWINAEGSMNELSDNGTEGGYKLNSWGGTVGFDVDVCPTFTAGMAFTAMYGDLDVTGADTATGDLDTYYLSAFARYSESAWTHTFVATVGTGDISMKRTVLGSEQKVETDSLSFGLMYEVGRVFALDEDGSACLQPVFNVTWKHTTVDGYTEEGSDLALKVDEQTVDTVTFGLGARLQAVVGESMYNRTSIFEARVLAKADVGDRNGSADVALASLPDHKAGVESAEMGAFGLEAGAGLTIPVGEEGGSIFMDASVELRSDYTDVNGTVGYRINF